MFKKGGQGYYAVCQHCKPAIGLSLVTSKKPPKFAIANGFAIGSFPDQISYPSPNKEGESRSIDVLNDTNEVMKALVAPVRSFGYIFQHFGGSQKCIQGHDQFFETDQNCVTGTMNYLTEQNVNNIFVMMCAENCHFSQNSIRY